MKLPAKSLLPMLLCGLLCGVFAGCRPSPSVPERSYFPEGSRPAAAEVLQMYRRLGFTRLAEQLENEMTPCVQLIPDPALESSARLHYSRIGGLPDLPDRGMWPQYEGKSLSFVAQLNLDELPSDLSGNPLPRHGMLYFFYETEQSTWGFDPKDRGSWRVIYAEAVREDVAATPYPADVPKEARFKEVRLRLEKGTSIPDPTPLLEDSSLTDEQQEQAQEVYGQFEELCSPRHQLLGHAEPIQGDMKLECQLTSHGLYCGDSTGYEDPKAKALEAGADQWRLLLQVDSDDAAGMMWGDAGRLFFWITGDDLRARRFDNVWMILQCY